MTPPAFFAVAYAINPWMDVTAPVDVQVAQAQWEHLHQTYLRLGHSVDLIEPISGLPDMVYTANGGFIAHDIAVVARFRFPERAGESRAYASWMSSVGYRPVTTRHVNEGQGDLLMVGERVLAGYGFRTDQRAHAEIAAVLGLPVVSLELVDPRFYHLDTALAVLDDHTIAYYPPAFSTAAQEQLSALFPDAIVVGSADAFVFGLNAGRGHGFCGAVTRSRLRAGRCRSVRAAQGRRFRQVLHAGDTPMTNLADATQATMALVERHAAHNYSPLPVVAASAEGAWIADIDGLRYLDWLAAYSAVNLGHRNPASTATAHAQVDTVTLLNRALHADRLGPLGAALAQLCGKDVVLPMNSDAEAVESGLRVARKWGADVNGLPAGRHDIILANNNFHGHTSSVVSFSSDPAAGSGVEPSTPGLRSVPFGDAAAPAQTIDDNTVADLLEPIPGQAGIIVPADDYLPAASSTTC